MKFSHDRLTACNPNSTCITFKNVIVTENGIFVKTILNHTVQICDMYVNKLPPRRSLWNHCNYQGVYSGYYCCISSYLRIKWLKTTFLFCSQFGGYGVEKELSWVVLIWNLSSTCSQQLDGAGSSENSPGLHLWDGSPVWMAVGTGHKLGAHLGLRQEYLDMASWAR